MSAMLRRFRRAPGRILASVFALTLAVGAIGVLAIPHVSASSLHAAVGRDGLGDIIVPTTPLDADQIERIRGLPNVVAAEGERVVAVPIGDETGHLIGLARDRTMDLVQLSEGRAASAPAEVVVSPGVAAIGSELTFGDRTFTVTGTGKTLWWTGDDAVFADLDAVGAKELGTNHLVITAADDSSESLRRIANAVRGILAERGDTFADFPVYLPDGSTPIDKDIRSVSTMIGLLGVVAGVVALTLLASTASTLITEQAREIAIMQAMGGRRRPLRRRLRRVAVTITAAGLVLGLPLGVLLSNVIAHIVLERFVGVTPDVAIDWRVLAGSTIAMLIGARLAAARSARRVTNLPLAETLRDREAAPFGRNPLHRTATRLSGRSAASRIARRSPLRRPGRSIGVVAQIATAVGAAFLIPGFAMSVNESNAKANAPWKWQSQLQANDPGLPFANDVASADATSEAGIATWGEIDDRLIAVYGMRTDTRMFQSALTGGRWYHTGQREVVLSKGFAVRRDIAVGDTVEVELASSDQRYTVVGLADDYTVSLYADRAVLAADLGVPGGANIVWSTSDEPRVEVGVSAGLRTAADVAREQSQGAAAIFAIFGAIGAIVASVGALAVMSAMIVNLFERRHEFATLQAMGAARSRVRRLLIGELLPLGCVGIVFGIALGALGLRAMIGSFEASYSIDIGVVDPLWLTPVIAAVTLALLAGLAATVSRRVDSGSIAATLRSAV